jgi:hypothetical protein
MIVAMITVGKMQPAVYEIIEMVTMRYRFVSAVWAVLVGAAGFGSATDGIRGANRDHVFIDVIIMHVMKMAVVKIVHVAVMANSSVAAVRAMLMRMVRVVFFSSGGHNCFLLTAFR